MLGLMDAGLGRKDEAIWECRGEAELMPISKNAFVGSAIIEILSLHVRLSKGSFYETRRNKGGVLRSERNAQ